MKETEMVSRTPKTCLITGHGPWKVAIGNLFLGDACRAYPAERLIRISLCPLPKIEKSADWLSFKGYALPAPREEGIRRLGPIVERFTARALFLYALRVHLPRVARKIRTIVSQNGTEQLWITLNTPSAIILAEILDSQVDIPLKCTVWDPPQTLCHNAGLPTGVEAAVLKAFGNCIRNAVAVTVASEPMRDHYRTLYGKESLVWIHATPEHAISSPMPRLKKQGHIRIVFAGSLYARDEFESFCDALESINWRIGELVVTLHVFGPTLPQHQQNEHIVIEGWCAPEDLTRRLSSFDIGYLPYWFDQRYTTSVKYCFPSKLSTYLSSGLRVFYHGPYDSSPRIFLNEYPVGVACHSLGAEEILQKLENMVLDRSFFSRTQDAISRALSERLGPSVFAQTCSEFIELPDAFGPTVKTPRPTPSFRS